MDISRKTDYALRMLSMLAEGEDCLLSVRTAAESVDVPYSFARSIQHGLVQAGIIESLRGVRGGMRLKVDPKDVTIRQIVEAVQGPLVMNDCTAENGACPRMDGCCYHPSGWGPRSCSAAIWTPSRSTTSSTTAGTRLSTPSSPTARISPSTPRAPRDVRACRVGERSPIRS